VSPDPGTPRFVARPRAELEPDQQALYDLIASGPRAAQRGSSPFLGPAGELLGPFGLMTIAPAVGEAVQAVGAAIRYRTGLSDLVREAAILLVAAAKDSGFEWIAHVRLAAQAGLDEEQLAALRRFEIPEGLAAADTLALRAVRAMLVDGGLSDALHRRAVTELGERAVAELVWLVGYYSALALALAVYTPHDRLTMLPATTPGAQEGE